MENPSKKKNISEPPGTVSERNKPNLKLMAKAFLTLYKQTKMK
jgi:hypothetical protein